MRHGYKGAFEIAATVDYLFAFAATPGRSTTIISMRCYDAYLGDEAVRDFMAEHNPGGTRRDGRRFREAIGRGLWRPAPQQRSRGIWTQWQRRRERDDRRPRTRSTAAHNEKMAQAQGGARPHAGDQDRRSAAS